MNPDQSPIWMTYHINNLSLNMLEMKIVNILYSVPKSFGMFIKSTNEIILISNSANYYPIVIWSPNPISSKIKRMLEEPLLDLIKY